MIELEAEAHTAVPDPRAWSRAGWRIQESGTYRYRFSPDSGGPLVQAGVVEHYACHRKDHSEQVRIGIVRDGSSSPSGMCVHVQAWVDDGAMDRLALVLIDADAQTLAHVTYEIGSSSVRVMRANKAEPDNFDLPEGHRWLPLMRNFLGPVLCDLALEPDGRGVVVVPDLRDPNALDVFTPQIETRQVIKLDRPIQPLIIGQREHSAQAYRFIGGPYDETSLFWVCAESQRLLRYAFEASSGERWECGLDALVIHD